MIAPIAKEKKEKQQRKIFLIIGSIVYIYAVLCMLHYAPIRSANPRMGIEEVINKCMINVFLNPAEMFPVSGQMLLYIFLFSALAATFGIMFAMDKALRKHDNPDTVNGEAHLMTAEELDEYNKKRTDPVGKVEHNGPNNMILSRDIFLSLDGRAIRRNQNVCGIGGSGAGKTYNFVGPNILQYNSNLVITDPSGEILEQYGKALEDNGYLVKVFNLTDAYLSNRYNPFHYILSEKDVFILVDTLIRNTTPSEGKSGDPFWEKSEALFISALILYIWHTMPPEKQTFATVMEMLGMAEVDENDATAKSPLDVLFDDLQREDPQNLAVKQYKKFKIAAGKTMKSILISVGVRLQAFELDDIKYLTGTDDFEFETFADTKQAIFVILPTGDKTFNFIVSLLYSQLFMILYNYVETRVKYGYAAVIAGPKKDIIKVVQASSEKKSEKAKKKIEQFIKEVQAGTVITFNKKKKVYEVKTTAGTLVGWRGKKEWAEQFQASLKNLQVQRCQRKCPNHVRFILDEFANIGQIPEFSEKLATIRKYDISCSIILQAISQLKEIYDKKWNTIVANCDTKLFLGSDDTETIEWLIKMMGKRTTTVENASYQAGGNGGSTSLNKSSIELMTIDQVGMMSDDECIVRIRGERPYYGKKYDPHMHPNYKYAEETAGTFKIPKSKDIKKRVTGPLSKRRNNLDAKKAAMGAEDDAVSSVHETPAESSVQEDLKAAVQKSIKDAKNKTRRDAAKKAKEKAAEIPPYADDDVGTADAMIGAGLVSSLGLTVTTGEETYTDEDIKEAVESMISLTEIPDDNFVYAMTE